GALMAQSAAQVEGPERFEGELSGMSRDVLAQQRDQRFVLAVPDQPQGGLAVPLVGVAQHADQLAAGQLRVIERRERRGALCLEAVDAAVAAGDASGVVAAVVGAPLREGGD